MVWHAYKPHDCSAHSVRAQRAINTRSNAYLRLQCCWWQLDTLGRKNTLIYVKNWVNCFCLICWSCRKSCLMRVDGLVLLSEKKLNIDVRRPCSAALLSFERKPLSAKIWSVLYNEKNNFKEPILKRKSWKLISMHFTNHGLVHTLCDCILPRKRNYFTFSVVTWMKSTRVRKTSTTNQCNVVRNLCCLVSCRRSFQITDFCHCLIFRNKTFRCYSKNTVWMTPFFLLFFALRWLL